MAEVCPMPKWGLTMEAGAITERFAQPGDRVEEGAVVALVETDKIQVELCAPVGGILADWLVDNDVDIPVGEPVMVIAQDEADLSAYRSSGQPETGS